MSCATPNSIIRPRNQIAYLIPSVAATYPASEVDKVTIDCKNTFQEIVPKHKVNM